MIRWRYKTLHFELKKDGILGSLFLDEEELERSLCRHGQDGWELVAVLDVKDGLIALCKQPFIEENVAKPAAIAPSGWGQKEGTTDDQAEPLVQPASKPPAVKAAVMPPEPEPPADLFGEPDDEDGAPLDGPRVDTASDEEGSGLAGIKIE